MQVIQYYSDQIGFIWSRALSGAMAKIGHATTTVSLWHARSRERQDLLNLDDHVLRDIGITRNEALAEAKKPFWQGGPR